MRKKSIFNNERILQVNLTIGSKIEQKEYRCEKDDPIEMPLSLLGVHLKATGLSAYENGKLVAKLDIGTSAHSEQTRI